MTMTQTFNCRNLLSLWKNVTTELPAATIDTVYDTSLITAGLLVLALLLNT